MNDYRVDVHVSNVVTVFVSADSEEEGKEKARKEVSESHDGLIDVYTIDKV